MSSTRPANHHHVKPAGDSAGQPLNRVFERYKVGIAQQAVAAALNHPESGADVAAATRVWQQRSTLVLDQFAGYPCVRPHGGWSLLIDTHSMGLTPGEASRRLFTRAQVAATPMDGWGPSGSRYLRLVFANEPAERLTDLRAARQPLV